jgi:hypothetical protein
LVHDLSDPPDTYNGSIRPAGVAQSQTHGRGDLDCVGATARAVQAMQSIQRPTQTGEQPTALVAFAHMAL